MTAQTRMLVAVHGIGDQFNFETIQSVAYRLGAYYDVPPAFPLGRFYETTTPGGARIVTSPLHANLAQFRFAEVYWADIPRSVVSKGYELEEAKKWVRTIVGRIRSNARDYPALQSRDFVLIEQVLDEMVETVAVLERLCYIAEKAGVFKFNLQRVLTDFLNDVQLVTEFRTHRELVLRQFAAVMDAVTTSAPESAIYIVAHSEGTVVTLAGLLNALGSAQRPPWLDRLRGIMTIGSPLDTHLLLWPELWERFLPLQPWTPKAAVRWHNYYDYGDPIADGLGTTRAWLAAHGYGRDVLDIQDFAFSRYWFPGKAHVDYWQDPAVFGHFIEDVVLEGQPPQPATATPRKPPRNPHPPRRFPKAPRNNPVAATTSYLAPYGLVGAALFAGVFLLYRAVNAVAFASEPETPLVTARNVAGLTLLLAGLTVAVRVPRLAQAWRSRLLGFAFFILALGLYPVITYPESRVSTGLLFAKVGLDPTLGTMLAATVTVFACAFLARLLAFWGVRLLLLVGGVVVATMVGYLLVHGAGDAAIWPVLLAAAAFFYLWWVAALLFDLVFVWHRYIRHSIALTDLRTIMTPSPVSRRG